MDGTGDSLACPYCEQKFKTINGYVSHCRFHRNECNNSFPCPIVGCPCRFSSYSGFKSHVLRDHGGKAKYNNKSIEHVDISLQCTISYCQQIIENRHSFIKHLKEHIEVGTEIKCPFGECSKSFSKKSTFSSHLSRSHPSGRMERVSAEFLVESSINNIEAHVSSAPITVTVPSTDELPQPMFDFDECMDDFEALGETNELEELYLKNMALFYLKLESKYIIPASTIQNIVEQLQDVHCLGQSIMCQKLLVRLTEGFQIPEDKARDIITEIKSSDLLVDCSKGPLRSNHVRKTTYKKMFQYVGPVPFMLGRNDSGKDRCLYYVPLKDSLKSLFQNKSVLNEYLHTSSPLVHDDHGSNEDNAPLLYDITDGLAYKKNVLFNTNPNALKLILYQDGFEVCNPLGSSKKKHKVLAVYVTLANFRPHLRYNVDHTLLVLLCNENDFKYFGQSVIFKLLLDDLKEIEGDGVDILNDGQKIKGTVCFVAGDNLGSHCIGGFVENFSTVQNCCRYCLLTLAEFAQNPYAVGEQRTKENYNLALQQVQSEQCASNNVQGIKFNSPFNTLNYFHVCASGLPPCLGHDLFEGIVNYDVALFLQYCIKDKRWFTYTELNRRILQFKYLGSDRNNQPCEVNIHGDKLGGQAIQNWCLVRLLPILIADKIDEPEDPVWQIFLQLRDIIELVCAPKISEANIAYLDVIIDEYLEGRHSHFPNHKMKPKHHYLKHYPSLILQFGPLIRVWTMRFESKHSYFKRCARHLQNFKNLCLTLTERHQLLQAYRCAGSFFPDETDMKRSIPLHLDTYSEAIQDTLQVFGLTPEDQVSYDITYRGTTYKKGNFLVVRKEEDMLLFGEIIFMIKSQTEVYYLLRAHQSVYNFDLHVYLLTCNDRHNYMCLKNTDLLDYYPLCAYGNKKNVMIPLKHAV
ncbi:Uncharacterised protein g1088 [Pycnogonum litorale]